MVMDFSTQFGNIRSIDDYKRAKEEFDINKAIKRAQIQKTEAEAQKAINNPMSSAPATLQINAAIQKALDAGDYDTANRIAWLQRSQAYGIDTFSPQGGSPETFKPFTPKQPAQEVPQRPMGQGIVPDYGTPEYVPTGQSINAPVQQRELPPAPLYSGSSIAQQQARNAALKKGAETKATKDIELNMNPLIKKAEAKAAEEGKKAGQVSTELGERMATFPQLEKTVAKLSQLGKVATYTYAGQAGNFLARQLGMDAPEGAVARKEYISLVDNQILPLLRQTFGAQFTAQEGESLKNTLGDPNASPEEKEAVLRSFIDQKKQTINSLEREAGLPVTNWETGEQVVLPNEINKPKVNAIEKERVRFNLKKKGYSDEEIQQFIEMGL